MTSYTNPFLCLWCRHLHGRDDDIMPVRLACSAFPDGIPAKILGNRVDHRDPVDGDNGVRFEPIAGMSAAEAADGLF